MRFFKMNSQSSLILLCCCVCFITTGVSLAEPTDVTLPGDSIKGIPYDNGWPSGESPSNAIDDNINEKYLHFFDGYQTTGFCVTPSEPGTIVIGLTFTAANDAPDRDPKSYVIYGSNTSIDGPWTEIASGDIEEMNQASPLPRYTQTSPVLFSNTTTYDHYQLLFPTIRNSSAGMMQIGEVELLGDKGEGWPPEVDAGSDQILILPYATATMNADVQVFGQMALSDVSLEWQLDSAPSGITMQDLVFEPNQYTANPEIDFSVSAGMYVLSLTATTETDSVSDSLIVIVSESLCPVGDLNQDCRVDTQDLLEIAEGWLDALATMPDLDGQNDGVDLSDFAVMAENWGMHGPSAVISEFMAVNSAKYPPEENELLDEDNESSDWIELCNPTNEAINLEDWYLTCKESDLTGWKIPELILEPGEYCIIFASDKNRQTPGEPLHTNFTLSSNPEFLALVEPDGQTIAHQYQYPAQYGLLSYGLASPDAQSAESVELVSAGTSVSAYIPSDDTLETSWMMPEYDPVGWLTGMTGVGYEHSPGGTYDYSDWIGLDVHAMYDDNTTAYIRIPFEIDDLTGLRDLVLDVMYDDGFVAYLNGVRVASANSPDALTWDAEASDKHDDDVAVEYEPFALSVDAVEYLRTGENILAIHGLNEGATSSDFLILPRLTAVRDLDISITSLVEAYFPSPTPAGQNGSGQMNLGPIVREVTRNPEPPLETVDLVITAEVTATEQAVGPVQMIYRVGFDNEVTVTMSDDGQGVDETSGDSIYTAEIPSSAYSAGDMVRWAVYAEDSQGVETRDPIFLLEENSPRYFGTVISDPTIQTNLSIFQYFVQDTAAAGTDFGTRCSVFYLGEFYDNVFIRHRGGYTTDGRKFQFNDGDHFRFDASYERVDEINVNERGVDPTYIRPLISFPTYSEAGVPASIVFPMHVIRNTDYLDVRIFIEQPDRHLLRRVGLDDNGSFYKVYSDLSYGTPDTKPDEQVERKITRLDEDNSDLYALREGISPDNPDRNTYLFDNVNVPAVISYLAACTLVHENDHTHKNYYLYCDTDNTGEWMFIPWDKDLTYGLNNGIGGVIADEDWPSDLWRSPSHPFFGSEHHQKIDYQWNRLFDAIYSDPVSRQMYLRRLRTMMDTFLQAPGTATELLVYENQIDAWVDLLSYELNSGSFLANVNLIKTDYLPVRRNHLYVNHLHGSTWPDEPAQIPDAQPAQFTLQIGTVEYSPASWNQDEEYIEIQNLNAFDADISGWTVEGGVEHAFAGGTVIPAGGTLYLTPNAIAFRNRLTSPTGGEHLFVQGNYKGHLSSWGETLTVYDTQATVAATKTYAGNPSDVQRYLRITEIMYHPLDAVEPYTDGDYEYLELVNTGTGTLALDGVEFTEGIVYAFADGLQLEAGEYLLLVKNAAAFGSRYTVDPAVQILSGYEGNLSNGGETIKLEDHTHSSVLDFSYKDGWYDITDGEGFSLVFAGDLNGIPDIWDQKLSWRASTFVGGSPGSDEQGLALNSIVFNEILSHSHAEDPDWVELFNKTDQDLNIGGWFLTDDDTDLTTIRKYEIPANTILPGDGYLVFSQESSFGSPSQPVEKRFGLSEAGETVFLFSGQNGEVTGYYQTQQKFDAAETGISFGRYEKVSLGKGYDFVRMSDLTPIGLNSGPLVPAVVITELMYDPAGGRDDEYVELKNRSLSTVTLMTSVTTEAPQGTFTTESMPWRIEGTGYEFDADIELAPGEIIILAKNLTAFASTYGATVPSGTRVFGPYDGKLDNDGENIELQIPGDQEWGKSRIYIPIEKIDYSKSAPWPEDLDDLGQSLTRIYDDVYADDYENWQGASPSPGQ